MPPPTFGQFTDEVDAVFDTWDNCDAGVWKVDFEHTTDADNTWVIAPRLRSNEPHKVGITYKMLKDRKISTYTTIDAAGTVRPSVEYKPCERCDAGVARTDDGIEVSANYADPTFTAHADATLECGGFPLNARATVAAAARTDVGVKFKYDPLRSGLMDWTLAVRQRVCSHFIVTGTLDAYRNASIHVWKHLGPAKYGLQVKDNARSVRLAAAVTSPCGRQVVAGVQCCPLTVHVGSIVPLGDWKLKLGWQCNPRTECPVPSFGRFGVRLSTEL